VGSEPAPIRRRGLDLTARERWLRLALLLALLYLFLVAVDALGGGIAGLGRDFTDGLVDEVTHPLAGVFVGILVTVLAQSSSVTTATIVSMVGTGVIDLGTAVPMVMGANIGTTITNTLASLGSIRRPDEFRRAFTGATMHDVFNITCVVLLLPIELATGFLARSAVWLSDLVGDAAAGEFQSPLKAAVDAVSDRLADAAALLPGTVLPAVVLILVGLGLIFASLVSITRNMRVVMAGPAERWMNAVLGRSGVLGIVVGVVLTVSVQSSSISTSLLIPMIAAGVLTLRNAYPVTLGANIGTTVTALLAAMAVPRIEGLQIALVHLLFNLVGVLAFFPVPALRDLPVRVAQVLAEQAIRRRTTVLVYIVLLFVVVPLIGVIVL
jgi:solute carrier family 34 (sodium-dependent phosphate cotransporter)